MRLNLGCGEDLRADYLNVDFRTPARLDPTFDFMTCDLSRLPWPWQTDSVDDILMLDFLEHFPHRMTGPILQECWRVLAPGCVLDVQVPDMEMVADVLVSQEFVCNRCEKRVVPYDGECSGCLRPLVEVQADALRMVMGGQSYEGNTHQAAFTENVLTDILQRNGFRDIVRLDVEKHGRSWGMYLRCVKGELTW